MCGPDQIVLIASACGFDGAAAPEKGGAASGATSDNSWLSNHARSVKVAQKTFPNTDRMTQSPEWGKSLSQLRQARESLRLWRSALKWIHRCPAAVRCASCLLACIHLRLFSVKTMNTPAIATISCPMAGAVCDSSALKYGKNAKYLTGAVEVPVALT